MTKRLFNNHINLRLDTFELGDLIKSGLRLYKLVVLEQPIVATVHILLIVFTAISGFIASWIMKIIIDSVLYSATNQLGLTYQIIKLLLYLISFRILTRVLFSISQYLRTTIRYNLINGFYLAMSQKFSTLDLEYYETPKTNDLIQKVRENYGHRPISFLESSYNLIEDIIQIVIAIAIIYRFNKLLIPIIILTNVPDFINSIFLGKRAWGIWDAKSSLRRNYHDSSYYLENENDLKEIKVFRARRFILKLTKRLLDNFTNEQKKLEKKRVLNHSTLGIFAEVGLGISTLVVTLAVISGQITIGVFSFYTSTIRRLQGGIRNIFNDMSRLYEDGLFLRDTFKVLDLEPKIQNGRRRLSISDKPPIIELKDVWFKYPNSEKYVFKDLNFVLHPGENVAVVGENGGGKTTLVNLICRFYDVTKGSILINGIDIRSLNVDDWYKHIALLSQEYIKFHYTAKTNIVLGDPNKPVDAKKVEAAAKLAKADNFIKGYKYKYNQVLSKRYPRGIAPSIGQWQKIALARAFYKDAQVLILDEPTSAIDPKSEFEIFEDLFDYAKNKSMLIISHRFSTVRGADRIIVLDKGKIIEEGTHKELLKLNGKYKKAYELQKFSYTD